MKSLSRIQLFGTAWTVAYQSLPSMGFSRQEYWSGLPFPSPGDLPSPGIEPASPALAGWFFTTQPPGSLPVMTPKCLFLTWICMWENSFYTHPLVRTRLHLVWKDRELWMSGLGTKESHCRIWSLSLALRNLEDWISSNSQSCTFATLQTKTISSPYKSLCGQNHSGLWTP